MLHTCDNKACVNPAHLYVGTAKDNARDRDERNRQPRKKGVEHHGAQLTDADVLAIRAAYATGGSAHRGKRGCVTYATLASKHGVSALEVGKIVRRERWKHL